MTAKQIATAVKLRLQYECEKQNELLEKMKGGIADWITWNGESAVKTEMTIHHLRELHRIAETRPDDLAGYLQYQIESFRRGLLSPELFNSTSIMYNAVGMYRLQVKGVLHEYFSELLQELQAVEVI